MRNRPASAKVAVGPTTIIMSLLIFRHLSSIIELIAAQVCSCWCSVVRFLFACGPSSLLRRVPPPVRATRVAPENMHRLATSQADVCSKPRQRLTDRGAEPGVVSTPAVSGGFNWSVTAGSEPESSWSLRARRVEAGNRCRAGRRQQTGPWCL